MRTAPSASGALECPQRLSREHLVAANNVTRQQFSGLNVATQGGYGDLRYPAAHAENGFCCRWPNTCSWLKSSSRKALPVSSEKNRVRSTAGMRFISKNRSSAVRDWFMAWFFLFLLWCSPAASSDLARRRNSRVIPPDKNR